MNNIHGWVGVDKPTGISSAHCLNKIKRILSIKKIGHTGTLDPFASGVLCVAIGEATKTIQFINSDILKKYEFVIQFTKETDTLDCEGKVTATTDKIPDRKQLIDVLPKFIGFITQIPPKFSAIKVKGERAYNLARKGYEFELKPREVYIKHLELLDFCDDKAKLLVECSKGTYIRCLGAEIARSLGSLGYLNYLRRMQDLKFDEKNIISLEFLDKIMHNADEKEAMFINELHNFIYPLDIVLDDILAFQVDKFQQLELRNGKKVRVNLGIPDQIIRAKFNEQLVAICRLENKYLQPVRVFNI